MFFMGGGMSQRAQKHTTFHILAWSKLHQVVYWTSPHTLVREKLDPNFSFHFGIPWKCHEDLNQYFYLFQHFPVLRSTCFTINTAQKMKFSVDRFFSKCD